METLNLYQNNVAYDFDMFTSAAPERETETPIIDYPTGAETEKVISERKARKFREKLVAGIIVFVLIAAVFANIFSRAELSQIDMQINKQEKAISKLDSEITRLKCSLQSLMTYEMIEQSAVELGMQKLERRQITYVHTGNAELPDIE